MIGHVNGVDQFTVAPTNVLPSLWSVGIIMRIVIRLILYILAAGCIWYSVIVAAVNSGSKFFVVWDVIGAVLIILAIGIRFDLWSHLGIKLKVVIISILAVGAVVFAVLLTMIFSEYRETETKPVDYLIVLGAQMRDDGPSVVLKFRLDRAVEYLQEYPETKCIVSGGQGKNEPCSEAEGMKRYLVERGIAADHIFVEDQSKNTRENFALSARLIPVGATVGVLTNNFHMKRALYLAEKTGINKPVAVVADSTPLYAPNNVLREVLGLAKDIVVN